MKARHAGSRTAFLPALGPVLLVVLVVLVFVLGTRESAAQELNRTPEVEPRPTARLTYERAGGASSCPAEDTLRAAVASRLGHDPFRADDERTAYVSIDGPKGGPFRATLKLLSRDGAVRGTRELRSASSDCDELFLAVTLALAIAIDPLHGDAPAPPATTAPVPEAAPPPAPPPSPPPAPPAPSASASERDATSSPPSERLRVRPMVAFLGSTGVVPDLSIGALAGVSLRQTWASLGIEGRWDAPRSLRGAAGSVVSAMVATGHVVPCAHWKIAFGCVPFALGAMFGTGEEVQRSRSDATLYALLGLRIGIEPELTSRLRLHLHAELDKVLTPTSLQIDRMDVWSTPGFAATLAAGIKADL